MMRTRYKVKFERVPATPKNNTKVIARIKHVDGSGNEAATRIPHVQLNLFLKKRSYHKCHLALMLKCLNQEPSSAGERNDATPFHLLELKQT